MQPQLRPVPLPNQPVEYQPDASSSPAVLESPAKNRSTDQTGTLSVQPIAAVLTTAITRPHR